MPSWDKLIELFERLVELPPEQRAVYLDKLCGDDASLRSELQRLLNADEQAKSFMIRPAVCGTASLESASPAVFFLGQKVADRYHITRFLGEGGMGQVYQAKDDVLDRFVALKTLRPEKLADPGRKRRFIQEAKSASALNHPNIVHIYDISDAAGVQFIAMEYVPGQTLNQLLERNGLELKEALKYAIQIADAFAKAHSAGIVHRDLKPSNIIVTGDGLVKVLDFGLAKLTEPVIREPTETAITVLAEKADTAEGTIVGTVAYMSPEQAGGKPIDARSDIFSFGSLLYEMIAGRRAFHGDSQLSTLSAVLKEEPTPLSALVADLPHDLEKTVTRCLRKDRERRFQTMADLKVALEDLKEASEPGKAGSAVAGDGASASQRDWYPWGVAAASLVVVLILAGVAWLRWPPSPQPEALAQPAQPAQRQAVRITTDGTAAEPAISLDGKLVAYSSAAGVDIAHIWVRQTAGGEPLQVTNNAKGDSSPDFSSDGTRIVFRSEKDGGGIYVVPTLGGEPRLVAKGGFYPRFSPDGGSVLFTTAANRQPSVEAGYGAFIVPAQGGVPAPVHKDFLFFDPVMWAPSGKEILFYGARKSTNEYLSEWGLWLTVRV